MSELKPHVTWSPPFSRASRSLQVISISDCSVAPLDIFPYNLFSLKGIGDDFSLQVSIKLVTGGLPPPMRPLTTVGSACEKVSIRDLPRHRQPLMEKKIY